MRSHIVRPFRCMPKILAAFRHQSLKKVPHIERHVWVGILLNHQRTGRVLDECGQQAVLYRLFRQPLLDRGCEGIEAFAAS